MRPDCISLRNSRSISVLVVEDEYLIADDLRQCLEKAGAEVVGPAGTESAALTLIGEECVDCAIVDIKLGGHVSFEVARTLARLSVPFLFVSGYEQSFLPPEFASVPLLVKPFTDPQLVAMLATL